MFRNDKVSGGYCKSVIARIKQLDSVYCEINDEREASRYLNDEKLESKRVGLAVGKKSRKIVRINIRASTTRRKI